MLFQAVVSAPGFALGIACDDREVSALTFLPPAPSQAPATPLAAEAARQLAAWLADPAATFSLPLKPAGTPFQNRVWQAIAAIPRGQRLTYGQIAQAIGSAPRAVGQACGANPYPIVVPCHRVHAAHSLGGFNHHDCGWLLDVKRWLLAHEGHPAP